MPSAADPTSTPLDPNLHAFRPDLADAALADMVAADRYVEPVLRRTVRPTAPLATAPDPRAPLGSELWFGEAVKLFDVANGWAWVQSVRDGYVGYTPAGALGPMEPAPTHKIAGRAAYIFADPGMKHPPLATLPMDAAVALAPDRDPDAAWQPLADGIGYLHKSQLRDIDRVDADWATVAESLIGAPYLWGGRSSLGLDCSGLVQTCLGRCGIAVLRDTYMQETTIGSPVDPTAPLRRGDIVFLPGHVGILLDAERICHANATHMAVTVERLTAVVARSSALDGRGITAIRRPDPSSGPVAGRTPT